MAKSDELGGQRSQMRHNLDNLGAGGFLWILLQRMDSLDSTEKMVLMGAGMAFISAALKFWSTHDLGGKLLKKLGLGALVVLLSTSVGCAVFAGSSKPELFEGVNGETIVACEIKGIAFTFGDADICRNVEGGHISEPFAGVLSGLFETVLRVVGGIFTGIGGVGAAISPDNG